VVRKPMVTYGKILHKHGGTANTSSLCVMEDGTLVDEATVQRAWAEGVDLPADLVTVDGRPIKIISAGWHRAGEGPDFGGARIELDGTEISGDIEIELRADGWYTHGHSLNPRFANVILHVFLEPNAPARPTKTIDGHTVPQLSLADVPLRIPPQSKSRRASPRVIVPEGRCGCGAAGTRSPTEVLTLLGAAGDWRLLSKSVQLDDTLSADDIDTVFYEGLITALGYRAYKIEFRRLARQLPYKITRSLVDGMSQDESVESLRAVYLGSAGLLPRSVPEDQYVAGLNRRWERLQSVIPPAARPGYYAWRHRGVRPVNRPERRLAAAAVLVDRYRDRGIGAYWIERIRSTGAEPRAPAQFIEDLMVPADGYWCDRYGFGVSGRARGQRLVGRARANEILVNAVLPAALAVARRDKDEPLRTRVMSAYSRLPRGERNSVVELMQKRLFPDGLPLRKYRLGARHQQGMLQVYNDWCAGNPGCTDCPMLDNCFKAD